MRLIVSDHLHFQDPNHVCCVQVKMNKFNVACFLAALLVIGACAEPRKLLANSAEGSSVAEAEEHQRILAELEEVHALRERMLQEGELCSLCGLEAKPA